MTLVDDWLGRCRDKDGNNSCTIFCQYDSYYLEIYTHYWVKKPNALTKLVSTVGVKHVSVCR